MKLTQMFVLLALGLAGCAAATPASTPTPAPSPTPLPSPTPEPLTRLALDFVTAGESWPLAAAPGLTLEPGPDGLRLAADTDRLFQPLHDQPLANVALELALAVDAELNPVFASPVCRWESASDYVYATPWVIYRHTPDGPQTLGKWLPAGNRDAPSLARPAANEQIGEHTVMRIRLECDGDWLRLYHNDVLYVLVRDPAPAAGLAGLQTIQHPDYPDQAVLRQVSLTNLDWAPVAAPGLLLREDFTVPDDSLLCQDLSGLSDASRGLFADCSNRVARLFAQADPGFNGWQVTAFPPATHDTIIEAEFTPQNPASYYGLAARDNPDGYYLFLVAPGGAIEIIRLGADGNEQGWYSLLNGYEFNDWWTPSPLVQPGPVTHILRVELRGYDFEFYINGELAAAVSDQAAGGHASGGAGVVISHFDGVSAEVLLDNFRVELLE